MPVDAAGVLGQLRPDDRSIGIRGVVPASFGTGDERGFGRLEPQSHERNRGARRDALDGVPVGAARVDGIDDDAVAGPDDLRRGLSERRETRSLASGAYPLASRRSRADTPDRRFLISSLRRTTAPGTAPIVGARLSASVDLPVPENPPIAMSDGRGGCSSSPARPGYCRAPTAGSLAARRRSAVAPLSRSSWLGPPPGRTETAAAATGRLVVAGLGQVAVHHDVGVAWQLPAPEIHQQERQVVQDVDAGDLVVELDAVEQRRPPVEQDDVAQMQVAVALADEASPRAERRAAPAADPAHDARRAVTRSHADGSSKAAPNSANPLALPSMTQRMPGRAAVVGATLGAGVKRGDRVRQR